MASREWGALPTNQAYDAVHAEARALMLAKNADYGDAWRLMRVTTFVDRMRVKLARIDQLMALCARGELPQIAEGVESELLDIHNEAAFAYITHMMANSE